MCQYPSIEETRRRFEASLALHHKRQALHSEEWELTAEARQAVLDGKEPVMSRDAVVRVLTIHRQLAELLGQTDYWQSGEPALTIFDVPVRMI